MKKVMVTGSTGFIGRHVIPILLEKGYDVYALYNKTKYLIDSENFHYRYCNLMFKEDIMSVMQDVKPDSLIHLAWYVNPKDYWTSDYNYDFVAASLNLLKEFYAIGGSNVAFAGTAIEFSSLGKDTIYGTCKRNLRNLYLKYCETHDMHGSWGFINYVYGPGDYETKIVPSLIRGMVSNNPIIIKDPYTHFNYTYVKDVANAFVDMIEHKYIVEVINILESTTVTIKDLEKVIEHTLNPEIEINPSLKFLEEPMKETVKYYTQKLKI